MPQQERASLIADLAPPRMWTINRPWPSFRVVSTESVSRLRKDVVGLDDQAVHHHLDGVFFVFGQALDILDGPGHTVDAHPGVALLHQSLVQPVAMLAFAVFHDGGQQQDLGIPARQPAIWSTMSWALPWPTRWPQSMQNCSPMRANNTRR